MNDQERRETILSRMIVAEERVKELETKQDERIGRYFNSIGAFGANESDPVGVLLAYADQWRTNWLSAQTRKSDIADKWISCADRMPDGPSDSELMVYVLCHVSGCTRPRLLGWYTGPSPRWYDEYDNQFYGYVLAWMPLPPLPE
jgi:hypothetical protein